MKEYSLSIDLPFDNVISDASEGSKLAVFIKTAPEDKWVAKIENLLDGKIDHIGRNFFDEGERGMFVVEFTSEEALRAAILKVKDWVGFDYDGLIEDAVEEELFVVFWEDGQFHKMPM